MSTPRPPVQIADHKKLWFNASQNTSQPLTTAAHRQASYTSLAEAVTPRPIGGIGLSALGCVGQPLKTMVRSANF